MKRFFGLALLASLIGTACCPHLAWADPPPVSSSVTVTATIPFATGDIRLIGYASPGALVTFLRQGSVAGTVTADSSSVFDKTLTGLNPGVQTFSLYATDTKGRNTLTLSFDSNIISGLTITLSGFLLPTTFAVDKPELKRPDKQTFDGKAKNGSTVTSFIDSSTLTKQTTADSSGVWQQQITDILHLGSHTANALVQDGNGNQSLSSESHSFTVILSADLNVDTKVNLTDFSILMFSYGNKTPPNLAADINDSGSAPDLVDFSVMMFHWTGN